MPTPICGHCGGQRRWTIEVRDHSRVGDHDADGFGHHPVGTVHRTIGSDDSYWVSDTVDESGQAQTGLLGDANLRGLVFVESEQRTSHYRDTVRVAIGGNQLCSPDRHSE